MLKRNLRGFFRLLLLEFGLLNLSFTTTFLFRTPVTPLEGTGFGFNFLPLLIMLNIGWAIILIARVDPTVYLKNSFQGRVRFTLINALLLIGLLYTIDNVLKIGIFQQVNNLWPLLLFVLLDASLFRIWSRFQKQRTEKRLNAKTLFVAGNDLEKRIPALGDAGGQYGKGYQVVGVSESNMMPGMVVPLSVSGHVADLSSFLETNPVDEILISYSTLEKEDVRHAVQAADYHGVRVSLVPETPSFLNIGFQPSMRDGQLVYQLRHSPLDRFKNYLIKRVFDYCFAVVAILCLTPVFLLVSVLIWLEDQGPLLYKPVRKGEEGRTFKCYKFRTMSVCDDPVNGTKSTEVNDPRITTVGKYLRKYDLDELPQFFNVLFGDMSVVGPRPHRVFLQNDFRGIINEYMVRHYVKPGITGWAQVNGWRGPTKTIEQKKQRIDHDLWYIERWNLWLDIKIVFLTVFGRKTRKNAF